VTDDILISKVKVDSDLTGRLVLPSEISSYLNVPVAICAVNSPSISDPYCMTQYTYNGDTRFERKYSGYTEKEAFMIIPAPDKSGAYILKQLSIIYSNKLVSHSVTPLKDSVTGTDSSDLSNQFYIQKSTTSGQYFFVNRKFCTAIAIGGDFDSNYNGYMCYASPYERSIVQLMMIKPISTARSGLVSNWRDWIVTPPTSIPSKQMFDRCAFKTMWAQDQGSPVTKIKNSRECCYLLVGFNMSFITNFFLFLTSRQVEIWSSIDRMVRRSILTKEFMIISILQLILFC
jgi:hypothetical protein